MNLNEMAAILAEIEVALDGPIQWIENREELKKHGAITYKGKQLQNNGGGWEFVLVEYKVDGKTLIEGAAMRLATVVRLTPEIKQKALTKAKA